jgi:hypothetical protein
VVTPVRIRSGVRRGRLRPRSSEETLVAKQSTASGRAPTKKPAATKTPAKKTAVAKAPAKKPAATKTPPKKAAAAKTPAKGTAVAKAPARKAAAAKAPAKRTAVATAPAKKAAAAKAPAKRTAVATAPAKKAAAAKAPATREAAPARPTARRPVPKPSKGPGMTDRTWPSGPEVRIPVERQKAAQAAGTFDLEELPNWLAEPLSAIRVGKNDATDVHLVPAGVRSLDSITRLRPGQVIVNYGKSEAKWATDYNRRRGGRAGLMQLLSYARQIVALDSRGRVRICLMGHAGQGFSEPLWVVREGIVLTVQPNDIILRLEGLDLGE